jgi:hypothetical protein
MGYGQGANKAVMSAQVEIQILATNGRRDQNLVPDPIQKRDLSVKLLKSRVLSVVFIPSFDIFIDCCIRYFYRGECGDWK